MVNPALIKERELAMRVLKFFEMEKEFSRNNKVNGNYTIPLEQAVKRACAATGISKSKLMSIKRLASESSSLTAGASGSKTKLPKRKQNPKKIKLDSLQLVILRNIINSFYTMRQEIPSLHKILALSRSEIDFPASRTTLRRIVLENLGYRFKKCKKGRHVMLQNPELAARRARYLRRKLENCALGSDGKPVTYIDEILLTREDPKRKTGKKVKNASTTQCVNLEQRWIIIYAGGADGFIPEAEFIYQCKSNTGEYHHEINTTQISMWLNQYVIPHLPPNGIIVIDNQSYHLTESVKTPTSSSLKSEMQEWLDDNGILYDEALSKPELYHLIVINRAPKKKYIIDEILKKHGHEVLRLPPDHGDLSPMETVKTLLKQTVSDIIFTQMETDGDILIKEAIGTITKEDWKKEMARIESLENYYWDSDRRQETLEMDIITALGGEETSGSEHESDVEDDHDSNSSDVTDDEVIIMNEDSDDGSDSDLNTQSWPDPPSPDPSVMPSD